MALAAFGTDRIYAQFEDTFDLAPSGAYQARQGSDKWALWLERVRACPPRARGEPFEDVHKDLAWACQAVAEKIFVNAARGLHARTGQRRLAMAGGVALNCVANAKILAETPIEELHVMPNAGDRGLAAGAALYGYHVVLGGTERHPPQNDYLGRTYDERQIVSALQGTPGVDYCRCEDIGSECAQLIARGKILGWVQGGCEFGPRALGHRSIVGDPRRSETKERLDREIKRREWFRPYAPSVLEEHANDYFEMRGPSPYMLQAVQTRPLGLSRVPGVVHVDGTARVQTVPRDGDAKYRRLISRFFELTEVPMVLNTSLNGYGEPIVETPADALSVLHPMQLDAMAVGDFLAWPSGRHP
jgi:carbamoyltransferase